MRVRFAAVVVALSLAGCAAQPAANSAKDRAAEQDACMAAGTSRDADAAIRHCTNALPAPDLDKLTLAKMLGIRGMGYSLKDDCDRAVLDYTESIAQAPDRAPAYAGRGWCYHQKGDLKQALTDLDKAIALNGRYADAYASRGWLYLDLDAPDQALADFNNATALDPEQDDGHRGLGMTHARKGDYAAALTAMNAVVRLKPKDPASFVSRSLVKLLSGDWQSAVDDAGKAIALDPNRTAAYQTRATAFFIGGEIRSAIADLEQARRLETDNSFTYLWLYIAHWRLGADLDAETREAKASDDVWPKILLRHYQGRATEQDVLAEVKDAKDYRAKARECTAAFFLAERDLSEGRRDAAREKLEHARDACPGTRLERAAAIAELRRL